MAFDFQLRFTGLNVLAVKKSGNPKFPEKADLFVAQTPRSGHHRHTPRLVFSLKSLHNPDNLDHIDHELRTDEYGRLLVEIPLVRRTIKLAPSNPTGRKLEIPGKEPSNRSDHKQEPKSLHWLPPVSFLDIKALSRDILTDGIADSRIAAHLEFEHGELASDVFALDSYDRPQLFEILSKDNKRSFGETFIANFGTLTIKGIDKHLEILDQTGLSLNLKSDDGTLMAAAVLNLPQNYPPSHNPTLEHLNLLYKHSHSPVMPDDQRMIASMRSAREMASRAIPVTPGSEACPVPTYFY